VPTYSQLRSDAQSAKNNSTDVAVRKLADTVERLTKKVKQLEDEVRHLKAQIK
jgi:hypothetical protein